MKRAFLIALVCTAAHLGAQIDPTGNSYPAAGPGGFDGSTWEEFQNNTGQTVNLQVTVTSNVGTTWGAWEGDPGVPTLNGIGPGATFWLATYSHGSGGFGFYSEERVITGYTVVATANRAPAINWTAIPGTVASGEGYTVAVHGHDDDGNLAQVRVWKNGVPFAVAGGGNGFDGDTGNATSDGGPQVITYTAEAIDASGASSGIIAQNVTVNAPPPVNRAPTIVWTVTPGTVASGDGYTVAAHGHDEDGNLAQVNVWKNGGPFAFAGGGNGFDGDSGNATSDAGPQTIIFTAQAVDANGASSGTIAQTVTVNAPPPVNRAPTIAWTSSPGTVASGAGYTVSAHGHDEDGNLAQVNVWKNSGPFAFAGGGNGFDGDSGNATSDAGPQTITFTAQAVDASGVASAVIAQSVTVTAPPPVLYTLVTGAGPGGSVSGGGVFAAGTVATVTAAPDATHDFAGWSGDAGGTANPVGILMDRDRSVQANFSLKAFALVTSATAGGSVTPGGSYPWGTSVTIAAVADAAHRFAGWTGDAGGAVPSVLLTVTRALAVQAVFVMKDAQVIDFAPPGSVPVGGPPVALVATASSGLPVAFSLVSGPATLAGNQLTATGPGPIVVQAAQAGDATYLPAPVVERTIAGVAVAAIRYRPSGRTVLHQSEILSVPLVLENP